MAYNSYFSNSRLVNYDFNYSISEDDFYLSILNYSLNYFNYKAALLFSEDVYYSCSLNFYSKYTIFSVDKAVSFSKSYYAFNK